MQLRLGLGLGLGLGLAFKNKAIFSIWTNKAIFQIASPGVFASSNSDKEKYENLRDILYFLSEGGMQIWNFLPLFEANVVPKYLQEIAGRVIYIFLKYFIVYYILPPFEFHNN